MDKPIDVKRRGYLNFFKDGITDALVNGSRDDDKLFSAYYKQGYDFGLVLYDDLYGKDWETAKQELLGE
jgi:hypothetical protein|tara:strand:- start:918 stop:1124 length:207 start_codon:yes stop_codon:yes gene_type:complete